MRCHLNYLPLKKKLRILRNRHASGSLLKNQSHRFEIWISYLRGDSYMQRKSLTRFRLWRKKDGYYALKQVLYFDHFLLELQKVGVIWKKEQSRTKATVFFCFVGKLLDFWQMLSSQHFPWCPSFQFLTMQQSPISMASQFLLAIRCLVHWQKRKASFPHLYGNL